MHVWPIVGAILIGLVAGWIADLLSGKRYGLLTTLVVGLVGAFLGSFVASVLNVNSLGQPWSPLAVSLTGAVILLLMLGLDRRRA